MLLAKVELHASGCARPELQSRMICYFVRMLHTNDQATPHLWLLCGWYVDDVQELVYGSANRP